MDTEKDIKIDVIEDDNEENEAAEEQAQPSELQTAIEQQPLQSSFLDNVVDDFSLQSQGIGIRFRATKEIRIYDQTGTGQLILEETFGDDEEQALALPPQDTNDKETKEKKKMKKSNGILIKTVQDTGYAFSFLRATYSLMALFVCGFLFILGICILLFLFIDLATLLGATSNEQVKVVDFLAVLLSVPVFIYSLAMGMTLATRFVIDTFYGHPFLRSFGLGVATTDWIAFVFYLGIPVLTFVITLFMKLGNWWEISLTVWFASILVFWCLFSACVLYLEIWASLGLMQEDEGSNIIDDDPMTARARYWFKKAWDASILTMRYRLAGTHIYYKKVDEHFRITDISDKFNKFKCTRCCSKDLASEGPYSFFANKSWNPFFEQVNPPERIHSLDEILGTTNYITRYSWSLEKLFCRKGGIYSAIPITQGPASITEAEINSNIACHVLGKIFILLLVVGILVWFGMAPGALGILIVVFIIFFACLGCSTHRLMQLRKDIVNSDDVAVYKFMEVYQHSSPKNGFTIFIMSVAVLLLYILPLIYLCTANPPSATLFSFFGFFSALRYLLNPRIILLKCKDEIEYFKKNLGAQERKNWKKKSLLYHIVAFGGDTARVFWTWIYVLSVVFFIFIVILAANYNPEETAELTSSQLMAPAGNYTYPPQPNLPYPTCRLKKGLGQDIALADFAFLSKLAYTSDENAEKYLDLWFGKGVAKLDSATIDEFKNSPSYIYTFGSAVSYKYVTFPYGAVVTIRGTQTVWDLAADAQLWLPAGLFQGLRALLPLSEVFTPILNHMVWIVNELETDSTKRVSFYRETTGFVKYLKDVKQVKQLQVTGHSLGGGLAIITGAQSDTNAVAISGVNAMLSRRTFIPPLSAEALDTFTFNVIPARDVIPMVDDKARLYQNINCRAAANNFFGCHDSSRSICEIQYTCGSGERPVLCECVMDYGYPEPLWSDITLPTGQNQTQTIRKPFRQSCVERCEATGWSITKCQRWKEEYSSEVEKYLPLEDPDYEATGPD